MTRLRALARRLWERFTPTPIPEGWTPEAFATIRPRWNDPLTHEVIDLVTDELGQWAPALAEPVRPVFFDQLRDLHSVDLRWQPSWLVPVSPAPVNPAALHDWAVVGS